MKKTVAAFISLLCSSCATQESISYSEEFKAPLVNTLFILQEGSAGEKSINDKLAIDLRQISNGTDNLKTNPEAQ